MTLTGRPIVQKTPQTVDKKYLSYVREQPCARPEGASPCAGPVVSHHVEGKGMGGSKRNDHETAPLCDYHHKLLHNFGQIPPLPPKRTKALLLRTAVGLRKR